MKKKVLFQEIGLVEDELIKEADQYYKRKTNKMSWLKVLSIAACLVLLLGITLSNQNPSGSIKLPLSTGNVSVKYVNNPPISKQSYDLRILKEDEIFSDSSLVIFKGTIDSIKNIELNFGGEVEYNSIATIKVDKVYRGTCQPGDLLKVLIDCPIGKKNMWVEDSDTVSAMREGMTGIFLPTVYKDDMYMEINSTKLFYKDLTDYGFGDGLQYAFLNTKNGLIFSKTTYPSLADSTSLADVEKFIKAGLSTK